MKSAVLSDHARQGLRFLLAGLALSVLFVDPAGACDTPVYRYAMYNWGTAPQMIFCFHAKPLEGKNVGIAEKLSALSQKEPPPNLFYRAIDVNDKELLERLDPDVRRFWETHGEKKTPWWLVVSAWGAVLKCEEWDVEGVDALADSPLRRRIAELLHDGNATVFLLLEGSDAKANEEAAKVAKKVIADVESNKLQTPEEMMVVELGGQEGAPPEKEETIQIELVQVSLDDAKEKGLVEQLLMVEPGLKEDQGTPMLFPIYGRGRAMRPFIGKGINERNLTDAVLFLIGDCSCMAKEQNPGVDLCFAWDWESTADAWALREDAAGSGQAAGGTSLVYQEYSLDELAQGDENNAGMSDDVEKSTSPKENLAATAAAKPSKEHPNPANSKSEPEVPGPAPRAEEDSASNSELGSRQIWTVSVVLGVLALGVFISGAFFLKR